MDVHPDRYSTSGVQPVKQGVALHTSEGGDGSYETLKWLLSLPGDRPIDRNQPNGRKYGSAYHALAKNNPAADYDQVLPAAAGPFAGPPLNKTWWHFCFPGRASQTRAQWLEDSSRQGILAAAQFIVDKAKVDGFPLRRISAVELLAGGRGYIDHGTISRAYPASTNHTDVGQQFPWDVLELDIVTLIDVLPPPVVPPTPTEEDLVHIIVGRKEQPHDPRRWVWNGAGMHLLASEDELWRIYQSPLAVFKLDPRYTLAAPYWMTDEEINSYIRAVGV